MSNRIPSYLPVAALLTALLLIPGSVMGQVSLTTLGSPYTQNFDTLPASGSATWTNNSTIPGWYHARTGTGTTILANDGSSNAGNLYSYGTGTATDRALGTVGSGGATAGSFFYGVRLQNNTGSTITSLTVSYTGEEWRNSAAAAQTVAFSYLIGSPTVTGSLAEFQSAGVAVTTLNFTSPITGGTAGALNGNLAANRVAITSTISGLSIPNGTEVMLRWSDPDHTGSDHGLAIDDFSVTPLSGVGLPNLTITDVTLNEGNTGTTSFTFNVSLSAPAGPGGVTFDIATADGTAIAPGDYTAKSLTGQTIPAGSSTYSFTVLVNGDVAVEPSETFFVNVTNVTGATVGDGQGQGTITNDDVTCSPTHTIAQIQGSGNTSLEVGHAVTTSGIVTGVKTNGFFIQMPVGDGDPATSDGIFVFTSSAPTVAVGSSVCVSATVQEFIPSTDPNSPSTTELASASSIATLSTSNALPAAVVLTAADTNPAGGIYQLQKYEGMRVQVNSLTVVAPTQGTVNEPSATSVSSGLFYGVITGIPRPFREPGVQVPDPLPAGSPCCVPRWDANPEILAVDSNGVGGTIIDVASGALLTNVIGPLDYGRRSFTINIDPSAPPAVSNNSQTFTAVPVPTSTELTIASFNMERFFDTVDDPGISDVALTQTAFNNRLNKASLAIRNVLRYPDVIGVEEMENLTTLQAVAAKVNNDAATAGDPNPNYQAYLVEGNDIGGIDVGFLVKTPKVTVIDVTQYGKNTTFTDPTDNSVALLNDRPPLVLRATAARSAAPTLAFTVVLNHLRSLTSIDDPADGGRVRAKREAQAEYLAHLIQGFQSADPNLNLISIGDYNAFQFNDGYADVIGVVKGTPAPVNQVVVPPATITSPALSDLIDTAPPDQRYSYSFSGSAQEIDHMLVNQNMAARLSRYAVARNDADFPEVYRNDPNRPERISDHDMPVAYFTLPAPQPDLTIAKSHAGGHFSQGQTGATYTVTASNLGPGSTNGMVTVTEAIPSGLALVSMAGTGWTCGSPNAANICTRSDALGVGAYPDITVTVNVNAAAPASVTNMVTVSGGGDSNSNNNSASDPTTINPITDVSGQVSVTQNGFARNRASGLWVSTMTVTNTSNSAISGPLHVVLTNLPPGVTMTNNTGARNGSPYITVAQNGLAAGASVALQIQFMNPSNGFISFTPVSLSGVF